VRFAHFLGIDWSGAKGARQKGIALAMADARGGAPALIERPEKGWSRCEVLDFLRHDLPADTLVGMDLGFALPFADCGAYFPELEGGVVPRDARELWALVDRICAQDPHLEATRFVEDARFARYFRRQGGQEGAAFHLAGAQSREGRFRVTEIAQRAAGVRPVSNFNLVGAAQVGKASLTGMRLLHRLDGALSLWPFDSLPERGSVALEIYSAIAARAAGLGGNRSKIRERKALDAALVALGSPPLGQGEGAIDDHSADALMIAAWLRKAHGEKALWTPRAMSDEIARTEGWTFGVV